MSLHLDELHRQYKAMLRRGLAPTGLVIEYGVLKAISRAARRDDPRIEWGASGLERLFGFRPQLALASPPQFTYAVTRPERAGRTPDFTLRELRAL